MRQFTAVFSVVCAHSYAAGEKNGARLHHAIYRPQKPLWPALVSDHHIRTRVKATETIKSAPTKNARKVAAPRSRSSLRVRAGRKRRHAEGPGRGG